VINFNIARRDGEAIKRRLIERYQAKFVERGIQYDGGRLDGIVRFYYPDFRAIAIELEYQFVVARSSGQEEKAVSMRAG